MPDKTPNPNPDVQETIVNPQPKYNPDVDVKKLMEKVRKEEKDKLYPQLEHYKQSQTQLQKQIESLNSQIELIRNEDNKKGKEKTDEFANLQKSFAEMQKDNVLLKQQQEALINESRAQIVAMRLEAYKANAVAKAGPRIIPELIYGNSEAEIDAAIIESQKRFNEIETSVKQVLTNEKKHVTVPNIGGQPPKPLSRPGAEELTAEQIAGMSPEEWAKKRMSIRKDVDNTMKAFFGK